MCGIVGAVSERQVSGILLEGLRRLEYRGYDSAGMAIHDGEALGACVVLVKSRRWPMLKLRRQSVDHSV